MIHVIVLRLFAVASLIVSLAYGVAVRGQDDQSIGESGKALPNVSDTVVERLEVYLQKNRRLLPPRVVSDLKRIISDSKTPFEHEAPASTASKILEPVSGSTLQAAFPVSVRAAEIPAGYHLWIAIERGNLIWPKEPHVALTDGEWSEIVFEGGPSAKLNLILISVDGTGHKRILKWFQDGDSSGQYLGLTLRGLGGIRLDTVTQLQIQ